MIITLEKEMISVEAMLPCPVCGTPTKHILTKSGDCYVCGCGDVMKIEYKEIEQ